MASGSDTEEKPAANQPYLALLESLTKDSVSSSAPSAKRRKLDHEPKQQQIPAPVQEEEDINSGDEQEDIDHVEEPEEGPGHEDEQVDEDSDDDDIPDASDPFETHFVNPDSIEYNIRLKGIQSNTHQSKQLEKNSWRVLRSIPGPESDRTNQQLTTFQGPSSLKLKHRLIETSQKQRPTFDKLEQVLYPVTFGYQDLLFCGRNANNSENLRRMACLHAVNHVFK